MDKRIIPGFKALGVEPIYISGWSVVRQKTWTDQGGARAENLALLVFEALAPIAAFGQGTG
jgi:hypothetical protein